MRNLVIIIGSSSSIIAPNRHQHHLFSPKHPPFFFLHNFISISLSKPTSPTPPSSSSSTSSSTSPQISTLPLVLISSQLDTSDGNSSNNLSYYADIASNLIEDGRFEDFGMVVESVLRSGVIEPSDFGKLLNLKLVRTGIVKGLREGRIRSIFGLLGCFHEFGVDVLGLFDGSAMELLKRECYQTVNNGNLEEAVELMETLAGFKFSIRDLVKPNDMLRMFIYRRDPSLAVRYACLLPRADIMFCTIIREFGKRKDLVSALEVFEASKQKLNGHNMYAYRTIIDVCGVCGDCFKSRLIYEDLLVQKVTPNIYVFNSLMNVNAHDLSYTMEVYKQMQSLGIEADMTSHNILLKACCLSGRVDLAQDIYREVKRLESTGALKMDVFTYSTIIKVFADAKLWKMAIKIKDDMLTAGVTPNGVTWSSLISACANAGLVDQATQLFEEMVTTGCEPNSQCFNTLLHACVEACQYDRAFRLFKTWKSSVSQGTRAEDSSANTESISMVQSKNEDYLSFARSLPFRPTTTTYNILLKACGTDFHHAKSLMDEMKTLGLSPNHISWTILIDICGGAGNVEGALQILNSMGESGIKPDVVAYTTAIKVCVENKNFKVAFSLFAEMKRYGIKPNLVTYNTLLRARTRYGSLQEVQRCLAIYKDMRKAGYNSNDYYLRLLIEEWCEGVIQKNIRGGQSSSRNRADIGGLRSLILERVAAHLQNNTAESRVIDIQGLTKVEARLVVLAVLRMIKEKHNSGCPIKDDLIIILGFTKVGEECMVKDAITKLLNKELGLEVISVRPSIIVDRERAPNTSSNSTRILGIAELSTGFDTPRRPAVMQRLLITRKSLYDWLQRRLVTVSRS